MIHLSLPEDPPFPFLPYSPLSGSLFTKNNPHRRPVRDPCLGYLPTRNPCLQSLACRKSLIVIVTANELTNRTRSTHPHLRNPASGSRALLGAMGSRSEGGNVITFW
jgi:hypothetical protein